MDTHELIRTAAERAGNMAGNAVTARVPQALAEIDAALAVQGEEPPESAAASIVVKVTITKRRDHPGIAVDWKATGKSARTFGKDADGEYIDPAQNTLPGVE